MTAIPFLRHGCQCCTISTCLQNAPVGVGGAQGSSCLQCSPSGGVTAWQSAPPPRPLRRGAGLRASAKRWTSGEGRAHTHRFPGLSVLGPMCSDCRVLGHMVCCSGSRMCRCGSVAWHAPQLCFRAALVLWLVLMWLGHEPEPHTSTAFSCTPLELPHHGVHGKYPKLGVLRTQ